MFHNRFIRTSQRHLLSLLSYIWTWQNYQFDQWLIHSWASHSSASWQKPAISSDWRQQKKSFTIGSKQFPNANWIEPVGISCCHFCILFPSLLRRASSHTMWYKYVCRANEWDPFQAHLLYANSPWRANLKSEFTNEKLPCGDIWNMSLFHHLPTI